MRVASAERRRVASECAGHASRRHSGGRPAESPPVSAKTLAFIGFPWLSLAFCAPEPWLSLAFTSRHLGFCWLSAAPTLAFIGFFAPAMRCQPSPSRARAQKYEIPASASRPASTISIHFVQTARPAAAMGGPPGAKSKFALNRTLQEQCQAALLCSSQRIR
jgi:hypothetical protein